MIVFIYFLIFFELAQSGYQDPELTCPDHDYTRAGTIGTCLLKSPAIKVIRVTGHSNEIQILNLR